MRVCVCVCVCVRVCSRINILLFMCVVTQFLQDSQVKEFFLVARKKAAIQTEIDVCFNVLYVRNLIHIVRRYELCSSKKRKSYYLLVFLLVIADLD